MLFTITSRLNPKSATWGSARSRWLWWPYGSIALYYISLLSGLGNIEDQNRNPNVNNRDHLVGRPTRRAPATVPASEPRHASVILLRSDYPGEAANVEDWGAAYVEKEEIHSYCEGILRYKGNCYYDWILNCQKKLLTSFYFYVARFIDLIKIF